MMASKRANAMPSAFVARQSLNDEELVSTNSLIAPWFYFRFWQLICLWTPGSPSPFPATYAKYT